MNQNNSKYGNNDPRRTNRFYTSLDESSDYDWTLSDDESTSVHAPARACDNHRSVAVQTHDGQTASATAESSLQNLELRRTGRVCLGTGRSDESNANGAEPSDYVDRTNQTPRSVEYNERWAATDNDTGSSVVRIWTNSHMETQPTMGRNENFVDVRSSSSSDHRGNRGRAVASNRVGSRSMQCRSTRAESNDPSAPRVRLSSTSHVRTSRDSSLLPRRYLHEWPATTPGLGGTATVPRQRPATAAADGNRTTADRRRDSSPVRLCAYYFRPRLHQALYPESMVNDYEPAPADWQPDVGPYSSFAGGIGRQPNRLPPTSERYDDVAHRNVNDWPAEAYIENRDIEDVSMPGMGSDEFVSSCSSDSPDYRVDTDEWDQSCSFRFPDDRTHRNDVSDAAHHQRHHDCPQHQQHYEDDARSTVSSWFSAEDRQYTDIWDTSMPLNSYEERANQEHVDWPMEAYLEYHDIENVSMGTFDSDLNTDDGHGNCSCHYDRY